MSNGKLKWPHVIITFIGLPILGIIFRGVFCIIDGQSVLGLSWSRIIEGGVSGLGVAIGILIVNLKGIGATKRSKLIPYCCGGCGVAIYKIGVWLFSPSNNLKKK